MNKYSPSISTAQKRVNRNWLQIGKKGWMNSWWMNEGTNVLLTIEIVLVLSCYWSVAAKCMSWMKIQERERNHKGRMNDRKSRWINNKIMLENFNFIERKWNDAAMLRKWEYSFINLMYTYILSSWSCPCVSVRVSVWPSKSVNLDDIPVCFVCLEWVGTSLYRFWWILQWTNWAELR